MLYGTVTQVPENKVEVHWLIELSIKLTQFVHRVWTYVSHLNPSGSIHE